MNVVVTGAAGHLGSHLVPKLQCAGFTVTGIDLAPAPPALAGRCRFLQLDLAAGDGLAAALEGAAMVLHCASIHPWKPYSDAQYLDANVKGTWMLYAAAAQVGIDRVVLTSSIAACGYMAVPTDAWPLTEEYESPLGDLYSYTKHCQEQCARLYADRGQIRTLALRPPAFMPVSELETGFRLTGCFAVVEDVVAAHLAAAQVLAGVREPGAPLRPFEAFFVTNRLPYTREDAASLGSPPDVRPLVRKYWPEAYEWLCERGFSGGWLPAVYDCTKAERMLGWRPALSFPEWFAQHRDRL
ncbi:MAG: NAD(P)-dependent oxidoreductase [Armatimonadetes bacterium]|nr:NAD(P)-dependent oxidoreductase [Armatimonadota bacterium]